jgi:energy-coupling factor transport system permease protein
MNTLYRPGNTFFHRCDSRTKLVLMVCFAISAFLFYNPLIPLALGFTSLIINIATTGRYALKNTLTKLLLLIVVFFLIIHGFVNPVGETPAKFFGYTLSIPYFGTYSLEGFYHGLTYGLRVMTVALIGLLYVSTTHPSEVVSGLIKMGLPFRFGFMVLMTLQLIPISTSEAKTIMAAQRARGLVERTFLDKLKGLIPLFVPLVVSSMERMETMAMALEARAFGSNSKPTPLYEVNFDKKDLVIIICSVLLLIGFAILRFKYGKLNWIQHLHNWSDVFWPKTGGGIF